MDLKNVELGVARSRASGLASSTHLPHSTASFWLAVVTLSEVRNVGTELAVT